MFSSKSRVNSILILLDLTDQITMSGQWVIIISVGNLWCFKSTVTDQSVPISNNDDLFTLSHNSC